MDQSLIDVILHPQTTSRMCGWGSQAVLTRSFTTSNVLSEHSQSETRYYLFKTSQVQVLQPDSTFLMARYHLWDLSAVETQFVLRLQQRGKTGFQPVPHHFPELKLPRGTICSSGKHGLESQCYLFILQCFWWNRCNQLHCGASGHTL